MSESDRNQTPRKTHADYMSEFVVAKQGVAIFDGTTGAHVVLTTDEIKGLRWALRHKSGTYRTNWVGLTARVE